MILKDLSEDCGAAGAPGTVQAGGAGGGEDAVGGDGDELIEN